MLALPVDIDNNMTDSFSQFTVSTADVAILPLVKRFFHSQGMRSQAAKTDDVIIVRNTETKNNSIIGALRLCPLKDSWLLRSMSIESSYQRQGIGLYLLNQIKDNLKDKQCYCFPYRHLEYFYTKAGFKIINVESANEEIKILYRQYSKSGKDILIMQFV